VTYAATQEKIAINCTVQQYPSNTTDFNVASIVAACFSSVNAIELHVHMVLIYVWPDDGSLTEPKHVAHQLCWTDIFEQFIAIFYNTTGRKISRSQGNLNLTVCKVAYTLLSEKG
jgi:hypothetical protein